MQKGTINMTTGNVRRVLVSFAIPIFFSQLFQQLYSAADSIIVGNLLGKQALAAVSSSASLLQLFTSLMIGIALGAGVVISRYFGAEDHDTVSRAVHTAVAFGLVSGVIMTFVGVFLSPVMLRLMGTTEDVIDNSISYFRTYFYGAIPMMLYNVFTGIMNALGDSKRPLFYLLLSSALNVALDLLFIGGFGWGVGSAAAATSVSQVISALLCYLYLRKPGTVYQLRLRDIRFDRELFRETLRVGLPTGIQNSVISIGNVTVQSNINSFGSDAIAACGVYAKLQGFAMLPIMSFTMALTTFISQNLGAKEYDRAKKGASFGIGATIVVAETIGLLLVWCIPTLVRLFNSDPTVVQIATTQSRVENLFFFLLAFSHAIASICRGAGRAVVPMGVMLAVWCVFRVIYITVGMHVVHDIRLLFSAYPVTWFISSVIFLIYYRRSDWVHGFDVANSHHRMRFFHG